VKLDGPDFVGKTALRKIKAQGLSRKLVGLEMRGRGIARHGYPLVDEGGEEIGVVTSGCPSPTLKKNIGLGYVPKAMSKVGTPLRVLIRGKAIEAEVVKTPFYKRTK
jgi:aminomethyltransferase